MNTHSSEKGVLSSLLHFIINIKYLLKGKVLIANVLPVFTGFWLALYFSGHTFSHHFWDFLLTMIASTLVISGALMFNNWFEHDLDQKMERTKARPTVTGDFSLRSVLIAAIVSTIVGLGLMLSTTIEAFIYSFLGWFFYVVIYTFWTKRRYTINTIIGSISGAFTPLIGWAVIMPANHLIPIALFYILFIWQIPHTIAIAIKRLGDYKRAGVPMLPVVVGVDAAVRQNMYYILALLPVPILLYQSLGWIFSIVSLILNILWIILAAKGYKVKDKQTWADKNLKFSLIYLIISLMLMIVLTI